MSNYFSSSTNVICYLMQGKPVYVKFMHKKLNYTGLVQFIVSLVLLALVYKSTPVKFNKIFIQTHPFMCQFKLLEA